MLLGEPPRTGGDLNFQLFGIPVRVHPLFWLIAVLLGISGDPQPAEILLWVVAVFVSILVHELGHALTMRAFGHVALDYTDRFRRPCFFRSRGLTTNRHRRAGTHFVCGPQARNSFWWRYLHPFFVSQDTASF